MFSLLFKVKECNKRQIVREKKVKYVHLEKKILAELLTNHPFIVKLCFTFQDEDHLCNLKTSFFIKSQSNKPKNAFKKILD